MCICEKPDPHLWNKHAVLTCDEMRRAEALSCARGTHDFFDLMLRAGEAVGLAIMQSFTPCRVLVLCGTGNNGGDGYVAAQVLCKAGWSVRVVALGVPTTAEAQKAANQWEGETSAYSPDLLGEADLIVDALFGTGLTRPLEGLAAQIVLAVTQRGLPVIAADLPSGINGNTGEVMGCAFLAEITVTFFRKKRGHVLLPAVAHCGEVLVANTGMNADTLDKVNPVIAENNLEIWSEFQPTLELANHKYHRGYLLVFGGAELTGASRLAARAAQRMGAGLVTLATPLSAYELYAKAMESVMVRKVENISDSIALMNSPNVNSLLIGPGLGLQKEGQELVQAALATHKPCVLDADALMLFAGESRLLLPHLHDKCVLTPHSGEFMRLFDTTEASNNKIAQTCGAATECGCVVLHKGADTVVASPNGLAVVNTNAPPWLATAGSGDVLAGMIAGRMAAGMPAFMAAGTAVFLHGHTAQLFGEGLIAEDLVDTIPSVLQNSL